MSDFIESHKTETYKSMISISVEIFKLLVLINGGAAAGVIAASNTLLRIMPVEAYRGAILFFVVGLVCAVLAVFFSWFNQNALHGENIGESPHGSHLKFMNLAIIFCFASLISFALGATVAAFGVA